MSLHVEPIKPDEIITSPGADEADAIRADYTVSIKGLRAYVSMGLRLIDVKSRLPHGEYLSWCERFVPDLAKTHLHRAKYVAEGLLEISGIKYPTRGTFDLPPEILTLIDGASGIRALLGGIQEYRDDQAEREAKYKCEQFFAGDAELRDEWEPRVLSGEISWCQAVRGIAGQDATKGKNRTDPDYSLLVQSSFKTICNSFSRWETIRPEIRDEFLLEARRAAGTWPPEVRAAIAAAKPSSH